MGSILWVCAQGGPQFPISPRLGIDLEDEAQATVGIAGMGGVTGNFNNVMLPNGNNQITVRNPFGTGGGIFNIAAQIFGGAPGPTSMRVDGNMTTTFRFYFFPPTTPLPPGASPPSSLGFVSFHEVYAEAWVDATQSSPGRHGNAEGKVTAPLTAWAKAEAYSPNSDWDRDPLNEAYRRNTLVTSVGTASSYADHTVNFSGFAFADPDGPVATGSAFARTGVVVPSQPDPLGIPEVGDNEYVYQEPGGVGVKLVIPCYARVVGGDGGTVEYFRPLLDWLLIPPLPDIWIRNPNITGGGEIFAESRHDDELERGLVFGGYGATLPPDNGSFGWYPLTMTFNGGMVHTAGIEVFYQAQGYGHPDIRPPYGYHWVLGIAWPIKPPNWFYYYWQAHGSDLTIRYALNDKSLCGRYAIGDQDPYVYIADDVINGHHDGEDGMGRRWETYIPYQPYTPTCTVFAYQVHGIDAFERAVAHELKHKWIYDTYHAAIEQAAWNGVTLDDPYDDYDHDGLPNSVELAWGFDPEIKDTTGLFSGDPDRDDATGDNEVVANIAEGGVFGNKDADWSDQGLNKGAPRQRELTREVRP